MNTIKKLSIKLVAYLGNYLTALACLEKLKLAWKEYRGAKKEVASLRKTFLEDQIARKAHDEKMTSEDMVKMLRKGQRSIQESFESRQIRGRNNKKTVLKAKVTDYHPLGNWLTSSVFPVCSLAYNIKDQTKIITSN